MITAKMQQSCNQPQTCILTCDVTRPWARSSLQITKQAGKEGITYSTHPSDFQTTLVAQQNTHLIINNLFNLAKREIGLPNNNQIE